MQFDQYRIDAQPELVHVLAAHDSLCVMSEPDDGVSASEEEVLIGGSERVEIVVVDYDPQWPTRFTVERNRIVNALGDQALAVDHIGSTSVPGLAAKPIIDICLTVADSADEGSYLPALEAAGYELRVREPDWHEHRMLRTPTRDVHLHVFTAGSSEILRLVTFRDRLRDNPEESALYATTKKRLAATDWPTMQEYADAKTEVIAQILDRATHA
jgi:GrpB-like predicted nucleotidyltransferase (UPF0157 family)